MRGSARRARSLIGTALTAPLALAATATGQAFTEVSELIGLDALHEPAAAFAIWIVNIAPMIGGGAVGDFNNDGWQDVLFIASGGAPDKLFINDGDGTFTDRAAAWGIADTHLGLCAAIGDYDGDGWLDVYVISMGDPGATPQAGRNRLYRNNGDETFTDVAADVGLATISADVADGLGAAWGDYDLDGDLDLFVACWIGVGSRLYRNDDGLFTDVSIEAGVFDPAVRGFSPRFVDMDGDRFPELLLAADFQTSRYFRNNGDGTFTDLTEPSGTGLDGNGMGQTVGDFDRNGLLDWYVTSIHALDHKDPGIPGTGNMQYMGVGGHLFVEHSIAAGTNDGGWGWGTVAVDVDHDGFEDIVETNGWPCFNTLGELEWTDEQSYLFRNNGGWSFTEIADSCGFVHHQEGRGLANADLDNDGDQDLIVFSNRDQLRVFTNDLDGDDANWLRVFVDTGANPRLAPNGFGTLVRIVTGGQAQRRVISGGCNYMSQSELSAHFGLGSSVLVDELRVEWNDGTVTVTEDVRANQTITMTAPYAADLDGNGVVNIQDFLRLLAAWGDEDGPADLNADGAVDNGDFQVLLLNWS
ncbi:MAG: FG-GAP-like repeat-containing protein [Planctomycetota bacterium]|jgi:hypothetical protein